VVDLSGTGRERERQQCGCRGKGGGGSEGDLCPPLAGEKVCVPLPTTGCAGSEMGVM
jgi:hypothetical protein